MRMITSFLVLISAGAGVVHASENSSGADGTVITEQNAALKANTEGKGFGPQSPRDIANKTGANRRIFLSAPAFYRMNICNIHFHKNAEHKGGDFTLFAGFGDGHGFQTGYKYSGNLSVAESKPLETEVCVGEHGGLQVGDTIEVHFVYSSAQVAPGPTLNSCLAESSVNPQLRVEAHVLVLVNDPQAADFGYLTQVREDNGYQQAVNIPQTTGKPTRYAGSTTGPAYNEKGSPFQVSWSVHPNILKVNAQSVGRWCEANIFKEDHAHGVRNLVTDEALLSNIN